MFSTRIDFGPDSSIQLSLPDDAVIADCASPRNRSMDDVTAAVAAELLEPLEFPPLARATVPGDRIVLAVDHGVPQGAAVVAGIVQTLLESAAEPESITVVQSELDSDTRSQPLTARLRDDSRSAVALVTHDPCDRSLLTYVAASREGKAIYLNRAIGDADVLIPVGCVRPEDSLGYLGVPGGLFPTFADEETQRRFWAPSCVHSSVQLKRRRDEANEALWLLGSRFTVQLVPGSGDQVLHVLAGDVDAVTSRGRQLAAAAWNCPVPRRAQLVVAAIEGGPDQQTWDNVARSLSAALRIVEDGGSVVVCCDLRTAPGPSLMRLAGSDTLDEMEHEINRDRTPDALPASQLAQALRRATVYLRSQLDAEVVEGLGVGHVTTLDEIRRLAQRHESCILLANSQHAIPSLEEELVSP